MNVHDLIDTIRITIRDETWEATEEAVDVDIWKSTYTVTWFATDGATKMATNDAVWITIRDVIRDTNATY